MRFFQINIVPITNLYPKYHMSKQYRTRVKWDTKNSKKVRNKLLKVNSYPNVDCEAIRARINLKLGSLIIINAFP